MQYEILLCSFLHSPKIEIGYDRLQYLTPHVWMYMIIILHIWMNWMGKRSHIVFVNLGAILTRLKMAICSQADSMQSLVFCLDENSIHARDQKSTGWNKIQSDLRNENALTAATSLKKSRLFSLTYMISFNYYANNILSIQSLPWIILIFGCCTRWSVVCYCVICK